MSKHRRPFETADGHMAIMPYSTKQWIRFLELVGETSLAGEAWVCLLYTSDAADE